MLKMMKVCVAKRCIFYYVILGTGLFFYITVWHFTTFGFAPVKGWEGNISRNITHYVKQNLKPHLLPLKFCKNKKLLTVIIASRPNGVEHRQAIRSTWGQRNPNVTFAFLMGETLDSGLQVKLQAESERYGDIIQERFVDTYNNLTLKTVFMLKSYLKYCSKTHKFLMKVDDDIFLRVSHILDLLTRPNTPSTILLGRLRSNITPYRNPSSKWYIPYSWYPNKTFPPFLCGPGYIMSRDVAQKFYRCTNTIPLIPLEDVYFTGICAELLGIHRYNSQFFQCNSVGTDICEDSNSHIMHYFTPDDIRKAYKMLKYKLCSQTAPYQDFDAIKQWIFFLSTP